MSPLEFRKIILVGYETTRPDGAPVLGLDGLLAVPTKSPIRMRIAFWVPQREPFRRREIGTTLEYLQSVLDRRMKASGVPGSKAPPATLGARQMTAAEYGQRFGIGNHLVTMSEQTHAYTMVAGATRDELEALRDGAIVEQIQDFTFGRQPSKAELRTHLMPHWEQRALAALGTVPNRPKLDDDPKPKFWLTAVPPPPRSV